MLPLIFPLEMVALQADARLPMPLAHPHSMCYSRHMRCGHPRPHATMLVPSLLVVKILPSVGPSSRQLMTCTRTSTRQRPSRGKRPGILLVPCRWHKLKSEEQHEGSKTRRRLSAHKGATSLVRRSFPPGWLLRILLEQPCVLDHETAHGAAVDAAQVTEHRVRSWGCVFGD